MRNCFRVLGCRMRGIFARRRLDEEFQQELDSHLEMLTEENLRRGLPPEEARRMARVQLGGITQLRETHREMWGLPRLETLLQDLRYGLRQLRRNPGFTTVAVLTLALGIGATTAIFTVFNAVLLRPLPYPHPNELVYVEGNLEAYSLIDPYTYSKEYMAWRDHSRTLSTVAAYMYSWTNLTGRGEAKRVTMGIASASFFRLLDVRPMLGRVFVPEEDRPGAPHVTILSHSLWESRFGGDHSIVGKGVTLDGKSYTVVGVLPAGFVVPDRLPYNYALWVPLTDPEPGERFGQTVRVIGRLKPGVTLAAAQSELNILMKPVLPKGFKYSDVLMRWHEEIVQGARRSLMLFLGAVGFLLLIACANVANLLLARADHRQKELAVRLAVGAGKRRIVRHLLTESTLLALLAGIVGLGLAFAGKGLLVALISRNLPTLEPISLDWRVLGFALFMAVLTGLAFGIGPALQASRVSLNETLKEARRGGGKFRSGRLFRDALTIFEAALSMVLLVCAALFFRGFLTERGINLGFKSNNVLCMTIDLTPSKYATRNEQSAFFQQVMERIRALPGVQSVAGDSCPPLGNRTISISGGMLSGEGKETPIHGAFSETISPDYFRTMQISLKRGRYFTDADRPGAPSVAIVNESFAHRYCPGRKCLGARITSWVHRKNWLTVVGVVGNTRSWPEKEPAPEIYIPYLQAGEPFMTILTRTAGNPLHWAAAVRAQVAAIDKNQPAHDIATLDELRARSLAPRRANMVLLDSFALLGLILASVGIYGVVSYSANRRTHEIGIRMALGAEKSDVFRMVIGQGLKLAVIGVAIGIAGALVLTRFLASLLYGVEPTDPVTFIAVSLILIAVAVLACYIPARRAAKVDPMVALRYE